MQEIRGSSPGRGVTDFCAILHLFISMPVSCNTSILKKKYNGIYTNIHKINKTYHCGLGILESKSNKSSNKFLIMHMH